MVYTDGAVVKNLPAKAGGTGDVGSIPGLRRSPGLGNCNPFQYSCLENPMDRGALPATVHKVTQSQTQLKQLSTHTCKKIGKRQWHPTPVLLPGKSHG